MRNSLVEEIINDVINKIKESISDNSQKEEDIFYKNAGDTVLILILVGY